MVVSSEMSRILTFFSDDLDHRWIGNQPVYQIVMLFWLDCKACQIEVKRISLILSMGPHRAHRKSNPTYLISPKCISKECMPISCTIDLSTCTCNHGPMWPGRARQFVRLETQSRVMVARAVGCGLLLPGIGDTFKGAINEVVGQEIDAVEHAARLDPIEVPDDLIRSSVV